MLEEYANERRKFSRFRFENSVSYQHKGVSGVYCTLMKNLSLGGLCMSLNRFIPKDSELLVEFLLKNDTLPIKAKAKVAWIQGLPYAERYRAGLEFTELDQSHSVNLGNFLKNSSLSIV